MHSKVRLKTHAQHEQVQKCIIEKILLKKTRVLLNHDNNNNAIMPFTLKKLEHPLCLLSSCYSFTTAYLRKKD